MPRRARSGLRRAAALPTDLLAFLMHGDAAGFRIAFRLRSGVSAGHVDPFCPTSTADAFRRHRAAVAAAFGRGHTGRSALQLRARAIAQDAALHRRQAPNCTSCHQAAAPAAPHQTPTPAEVVL